MTPALKTSGILAAAAALSAAALLLSPGATPAAKPDQPATVVQSQSHTLQLQAQLGSSYILAGEQEAYLAVSLTAPEQKRMQRPMVDLAVVLDRSGSMEGEKLAQAKLAAQQLISNLDSGDRFSLTLYGTDVEVAYPTTIATDAAKRAALMAISNIYTDGGTNLSGGLAAGQAQLLGLTETTGRVQRIVLISDGQANEGVVNRDELANIAYQASMHGVSITTVGVGLDFDEQTMTRIAVSGRGNYYFAESADMLGELFDTELKRLGATVATRIRLRLSPRQGAQIREIIGHPLVREGNDWFVNIPDMHAGETRKVIVALRVQGNPSGKMEVATVSASFTNADKGAREAMSKSVVALMTSQQSVVDNHRDRAANRLIERARTAQAIDKATLLYESGNSAQAQQVMRSRVRAVQAVAAELDDGEFGLEMEAAADEVSESFAKSPPSSTGGKRSRKANRKRAYDLKY
jgi:Ca-activated chloride channel family protein